MNDREISGLNENSIKSSKCYVCSHKEVCKYYEEYCDALARISNEMNCCFHILEADVKCKFYKEDKEIKMR